MARFWGSQLSGLPEAPGARLAVPVDGVAVHQYIAEKSDAAIPDSVPAGLSLAAVVNDSPDAWEGEVRVMYPAVQRVIALPSVAARAVRCSLAAGQYSVRAGATLFGLQWLRAIRIDLAYATAELTGMEYENGILAMEFIASSPGEAVLQLSHEPTGPLIAAGRHPVTFDWDPKKSARARDHSGRGCEDRTRADRSGNRRAAGHGILRP